MPLVVDASAILPLALPDEDAAYSNAVLRRMAHDGVAYAPPIFWDEVTNVLVLAIRDKRIELKRAEGFLLKTSYELPIVTSQPESPLSVLHAAHRYGLTSYDASYLTLALQHNASIATHDRELLKAAEAARVERFDPDATAS